MYEGLMSCSKMGAERPQNGSKRVQAGPKTHQDGSWTSSEVLLDAKNKSNSPSDTTQIGFSLDTSLKNRYFNNILPKHTSVTSCKCLEVLWSVFKLYWNHLESFRKAFWSLQNTSNPIPWKRKNRVFVKYVIQKWVLKQYVAKTYNGDVL